MINPLKMPDDTKEQINDKIKCFLAEIEEDRAAIRKAESDIIVWRSQIDITRSHVQDLLKKYSELCAKEHPEMARVDYRV